jgi:hypothetical protein
MFVVKIGDSYFDFTDSKLWPGIPWIEGTDDKGTDIPKFTVDAEKTLYQGKLRLFDTGTSAHADNYGTTLVFDMYASSTGNQADAFRGWLYKKRDADKDFEPRPYNHREFGSLSEDCSHNFSYLMRCYPPFTPTYNEVCMAVGLFKEKIPDLSFTERDILNRKKTMFLREVGSSRSRISVPLPQVARNGMQIEAVVPDKDSYSVFIVSITYFKRTVLGSRRDVFGAWEKGKNVKYYHMLYGDHLMLGAGDSLEDLNYLHKRWADIISAHSTAEFLKNCKIQGCSAL